MLINNKDRELDSILGNGSEPDSGNDPPHGGPRIHEVEVMENKIHQFEQLKVLENKYKETQEYLDLIQSYLNKAKH